MMPNFKHEQWRVNQGTLVYEFRYLFHDINNNLRKGIHSLRLQDLSLFYGDHIGISKDRTTERLNNEICIIFASTTTSSCVPATNFKFQIPNTFLICLEFQVVVVLLV